MLITSQDLIKHLESFGWKAAMVSVEHLKEAEQWFEKLQADGDLDPAFFGWIRRRYWQNWEFAPPEDFKEAKSVLVIATRQPKLRLRFEINSAPFYTLLPPTYQHDIDKRMTLTASNFMTVHGRRLREAKLPEKLISVQSGLAGYGRNNIIYIEGWGSFFLPKIYFTDLETANDTWQAVKMLETCEKCRACVKQCPTDAIHAEPFVIDASRCITFLNENPGDFPAWLDPAAHNCLIGCMICQDICPANKPVRDYVLEGPSFTREESRMILEGVEKADLPSSLAEKLEKTYLLKDYSLLPRNLKALLHTFALHKNS